MRALDFCLIHDKDSVNSVPYKLLYLMEYRMAGYDVYNDERSAWE